MDQFHTIQKNRGHKRRRSALDAVGPEADKVEQTLNGVLNILQNAGLDIDDIEEFDDLKKRVSATRDSLQIIKDYRTKHVGWDIKVRQTRSQSITFKF